MWKEKILLEDAVDLRHDCVHRERTTAQRWTENIRYIISWESSPTGYACFILSVPLTNENQSIFDVNHTTEVELTAVKPVEVKTIRWVDH